VVPNIPGGGGHWTRDLAFSLDGTKMFVSVGSASNAAEGMRPLDPAAMQRFEAEHGIGASLGSETERADVLVFDPQGGQRKIFATGIRNCVGLAVQPGSGDLWCSTNERDGLGDDLPPDYVTRVREGGFYGWPWYYIGGNEDPRHKGERPDLKGKAIVPDVLIQAHSASLGLTFYQGRQFPPDYLGSAFAAEHGSWNRAKRTGYKVIRIILKDGVPTGEYEDFVTGFVVNDQSVWGRPVGVTTAADGSLLISEDANGTIWRVSYERAQ
jgi:glucose/arabinose dehydrogenase